VAEWAQRLARPACVLLLVFGLAAPDASANEGAPTAGWVKQAPVPTWFSLQGIAAISPTGAWGAAAPLLDDVGELVHTTDAGRSWTVVDLPGQVNAVFFTDPMHGWAAGNGFFHSTDSGQTWIQDNEFGTIYDLFFIDTEHGWASGNGAVTYRTTDGGLHWTAVPAPGGYTIGSIWFNDQLNGWAIDLAGEIFQSTNGGSSWTLQKTVPGTNMQMIQFFDLQEGWAIGGDDFFHTTDGGQTWIQSPVPSGTWAYGARFFDRVNGVAVGEYGNIVRTKDSGQTWRTVAPQGSGQRLWDVEYADSKTIFLAGDNGVISRSTDGGTRWKPIQSGGTAVTHGFDSFDARTAWAGQDGGEIVYTTNGGAQWVRVSVQGFDVLGHLMAVAFANRSSGWAAGGNDEFSGSRGVISHSTDGGRSWHQQVLVPDFTFNGLETIDAQTAIAVGSFDFVGGGLVLRTTDGGATWQDVTPAGEGYRAVFFIDETTGWLVGSSIRMTIDGGSSWTKVYGSDSTELDAISFADPLNGWATGYNNLVVHSADGGQTWVTQDVGAPPLTAITGVTAVDPSIAWVAGWQGFVAQTRDGGQTWHQERIAGAEQVDFEDALFLDAQRGWVGGNIGLWRRVNASQAPR
jgi:photosystem II stability/assembly factor-like uncharacterized protein